MEREGDSEVSLPYRYIKVLTESYPNPITQTELARMAGVTKAAVTKAKRGLSAISDINTLALQKKIVLKEEWDLFFKLAWESLNSGDLEGFITSNYAVEKLENKQLHRILCELFPPYSSYFTESETIEHLKLLIKVFTSLSIPNHLFVSVREMVIDAEEKPEFEPFLYQAAISKVISEELNNVENEHSDDILNKEEVESVLRIRDKLYCLVIDILDEWYPKLSIIKYIENDEKAQNMISVYKTTSRYYLKHILEDLTNTVLNKIAKGPSQEGILPIGSYFFSNHIDTYPISSNKLSKSEGSNSRKNKRNGEKTKEKV